MDSDLKRSGVYVFKTTDTDSTPYNHSLTSIQSHQGTNHQQLIIQYQQYGAPNSIVKIKLSKHSDLIEFDVFFARISQVGNP